MLNGIKKLPYGVSDFVSVREDPIFSSEHEYTPIIISMANIKVTDFFIFKI